MTNDTDLPHNHAGSAYQPSDDPEGALGSVAHSTATKTPAPPPEPVLATAPQAAYCFSLAADISQRFVGEIQGGYRVDLDYSTKAKSVAITYKTDLSELTQAHLTTASILSGSDWAFMSQDGVVDFDSRITLLLGPEPKQRCLLSGRLRGRASLRDCQTKFGVPLFTKDQNRNDLLSSWKSGFEQDAYLPLVLAVAFDVPLAGFNDEQTRAYDDCRELGKSLLLGAGRALLRGRAPYGPVTSIEIDLWRAIPTNPSSGVVTSLQPITGSAPVAGTS